MRKVSLFATVFVMACSSPSTVAPVSVPLHYKMQAKAGEFPTVDSCSAISDVRVTDARTDKAIGRRYLENKSTAAAAVTTTSDVADWVRSGAEDALRRAGASFGKSSAPTLRLTVDQINTTENVLHRSGYEGRIVMNAELTKGGTSCWKDRLDGFAENYGYAGSIENYQETLNHALDRAMIRMMGSSEFKSAACSCGG
ncbi:MAG: hypothetical protein M3041_08530 [Acidobacteriota bacterium]|nr:hypothetical protein [Acidobacteriota bacterium]